jgi:tag_bisphos_ald: class II aldolase, tagatose bisphosphate family
MLMNMKELLKVADEKGFAVPAFNIGSDQLLKAVMQQVKEMKSPVILEMSPDEFNFVENSLIQSMIYEASKTDVPVVIHLDHGDKYETVVRAIQAGFTSVMIDASKLPYEENIAITQKVCEVAHLANVSVESELGTIGTTGNSIEGGTTGIIYTDPDQAKDFVEKQELIH